MNEGEICRQCYANIIIMSSMSKGAACRKVHIGDRARQCHYPKKIIMSGDV